MSGNEPSVGWVFEHLRDTHLRAGARVVALELAGWSMGLTNWPADTFPTATMIGAAINLTARTVRRYLKQLGEVGFLEELRRRQEVLS